ncbi:MAG: TonB family protein [Calditrichaceae bacterium]|nr:TonB family protein [Calditrichaceae bacterium]MBN2709066.1 TonB family protein [Calditrichaceae bacterium]
MRKIYQIILFLLCVVWIVFAQQRVIDGKTIDKNERWSGTIIITGDVVVSETGRLVIDPGTRILFQPETDKTKDGDDKTKSEIIIKGVLIARGTVNNKILFTSNSAAPRMGDWHGISISSGKQTSIIDYVTIEYAFNGLSIKKSNPQINNSQFRFNYNAGISTNINSQPKIIGNIISENGYGGIICELGAKPFLSENLITGNQIGIIILGSSQPNLGNTKQGSDYNSGKNRLFDNHEYNIYNHGSKDIMAVNNFWGNSDNNEILASIIDGNDERKWGLVNFSPILGASTADMSDLIRLSQESSAPSEPTAAGGALAATQSSPGRQQQGGALTGDSRQGADTQDRAVVEETPKPESPSLKHRTIDQVLGTLAAKEEAKQPEAVSPTPTKSEKAPETKPEAVAAKPASAEPEIDYNQIFLDAFLDSKKQITKTVAPSVDRFGASGRVIVRVIVGKNGKVESGQVLKGINSSHDKAALDAAKKFEFKPGTVHGKSIKFSTNLVFKF